MSKFNPADLKHVPIFLTPQEINDPCLFINRFYSQETDLAYARKELKIWFRSALSDKRLLSKSEMVALIGFKDFLVRLVEAGYLVLKDKKKESLLAVVKPKESEFLIDPILFLSSKENIITAWYSFPRYLSMKEFRDPFRALQRIFEFKSLHKWRKVIDELVAAAISECDAKSTVDEGEDIYKIFECLFKLLEVTHLIYVRLRNKAGSSRVCSVSKGSS